MAFSIVLLRRLYNTFALPCECVINNEETVLRDTEFSDVCPAKNSILEGTA